MRISAKILAQLGACPEGIKAFRAEYPKGFRREWTLEEQLRVLKHTELRRYLGWAWQNGVVPQWSMTRANLTGAYLSMANLYRANLTEADLTGANLTEADLTRADLTRANLTRADLTGADLTGANLRGADLCGANLTRADLTGADLTGAAWDSRKPPAGWLVNEEGRLERC